MREITFAEKISRIREQVHQDLDFSAYDSTECRNTTNCFSHAIGATASFDQIYRIGAISGIKPINEKYFSTEEVKKLLSKDMETLGLGFEPYKHDSLKENEYVIVLLIQRYSDGRIHDYHFLRYERGVWTEKWRYSRPMVIDDISRTKYRSFPWEWSGEYKITRWLCGVSWGPALFVFFFLDLYDRIIKEIIK